MKRNKGLKRIIFKDEELAIEEILYYTIEPVLFTCKSNKDTNRWLCMKTSQELLICLITKEQLINLLSKKKAVIETMKESSEFYALGEGVEKIEDYDILNQLDDVYLKDHFVYTKYIEKLNQE